MRKRWWISIGVVVLIVGLAFTYMLTWSFYADVDHAPSPQQAKTVPVKEIR